jgi:hypothetical protein
VSYGTIFSGPPPPSSESTSSSGEVSEGENHHEITRICDLQPHVGGNDWPERLSVASVNISMVSENFPLHFQCMVAKCGTQLDGRLGPVCT